MALGAATLADIYEPHERGTMMGIYYRSVPLNTRTQPYLKNAHRMLFPAHLSSVPLLARSSVGC